jgi:hypothetical protein
MKMRSTLKSVKYLPLIILTILPLTALAVDDIYGPERELTPSEMHSIMGQSKTARLASLRSAYKMAPAMPLSQTDYDVIYHKIELKVDVPSTLLYGNVKMAAKSLSPGLDSVEVDFDAAMTIDSIYTEEGTLLAFSHAGYRATIRLDRAYDVDSIFSFYIRYHGTPATGGFQGFSFDSYEGSPVVSSLSEPYLARTWWPCKDRPDDKIDSLDIFVTCDTALYCASNGKLIDTVNNGDGTKTFSYQVRYPITTYLFSVAISDYVVWKNYYKYAPDDSMEIVNHVYPSQYEYSLPRWGITPYAIGVFADIFGEYPFLNEKYGHANFEWGGGMEHQTVTSMGGNWFGFYEPVVVHELSHQWWGDMITCNNWHEIWLNEGFASYSEALYYEVKSGKASYHSYMAGMTYTGGGTIYIYDTTNVGSIFGSIVYDKGAWLLHMLRHIVGDANFFNILSAYYNSVYKYDDVNSAQFQEICESVSGMELDYFFNEWLFGTYYPRYSYSYMNELDPTDGKYWTYFFLEQTQSTAPQVFIMPIDLKFTFSPADTFTTTIFNDSRRKMYFFKNNLAPTGISLDPMNWILNDSAKPAWTYHIIPFDLDSGQQYTAYQDSVRARGGSGSNKFLVTSGALPEGLKLDSLTGVISGDPIVYGEFNFRIRANDLMSSYKDSADFHISVIPGDGLPGDANDDGVVNALDITYLINYLYKGGAAPPVPKQADSDRSCVINALDITYLINYLYKNGSAPHWGCV